MSPSQNLFTENLTYRSNRDERQCQALTRNARRRPTKRYVHWKCQTSVQNVRRELALQDVYRQSQTLTGNVMCPPFVHTLKLQLHDLGRQRLIAAHSIRVKVSHSCHHPEGQPGGPSQRPQADRDAAGFPAVAGLTLKSSWLGFGER